MLDSFFLSTAQGLCCQIGDEKTSVFILEKLSGFLDFSVQRSWTQN